MTDLVKYDIGDNLERMMSKYSEHNAVHVQDEIYTYGYLYNQSDAIRKIINNITDEPNQFIGILCYRSIEAYSGIIGTLLSKNAYLPLNPNHPIDKIEKILAISECKTIILGEEAADLFSQLLMIEAELTVICPNPGSKIKRLKSLQSNHNFIFSNEFPLDVDKKINVSGSDPAYLMFTSGSSGEPKGIVVSHKNLFTYISYIINTYDFGEMDRISQAPDISFDLSIQDIFSAFLSGGCLYVLPKKVMMAPSKYINDHGLTIWTSVPSVGVFMSRMKQLSENSLPTLRCSLFCGEGLPCEMASQWELAAPNSKIINFYGPTEATVMFMSYAWSSESVETRQCFNGLVSIGKPFNNMQVRLIDGNKEVPYGEIGELYIHGDQVINGYYKNKALTNEKFVYLPDEENKKWYRTGDLARKIDYENYAFVGRVDDQFQIRGNRVEMLEIDKTIRDAVGHQMAISIPILVDNNKNLAEDIVAFVEREGCAKSQNNIIDYCKSVLPDYMVPSEIYFIESMPLNQNGKIDKKELYSKLSDIDIFSSDENQGDAICCAVCLKSLDEDADLNGVGLIRIISHDGKDDYICHVCLKGF
jgi:amino acid adenylation domain-containing protein